LFGSWALGPDSLIAPPGSAVCTLLIYFFILYYLFVLFYVMLFNFIYLHIISILCFMFNHVKNTKKICNALYFILYYYFMLSIHCMSKKIQKNIYCVCFIFV
jgi:hypothetical protein